MQETQEIRVWCLGWEDPLEKEMATHSSILAWRISWTEETGGLQSMGWRRVGHDWIDLAAAAGFVEREKKEGNNPVTKKDSCFLIIPSWQSQCRIYSKPEYWSGTCHRTVFLGIKMRTQASAGSREIPRGWPFHSLQEKGRGCWKPRGTACWRGARSMFRGAGVLELRQLQPVHRTEGIRGLLPADEALRADWIWLQKTEFFFFQRSHCWHTVSPWLHSGFPASSVGKESACNTGDPGLFPGLGRSPGEGIGYPLQYSWASLVAQLVKTPPAMQETWFRSLGWEDPLEKGKAAHSSILAWRIPWTV